MSRDVRQYLTYCFRKNAKLKQSKEYLSKATIIDLRCNLMQEQLKKISGLSSSSTNTLALPGEITVKTKQTNQLGCDSDSDTEELLFAKGHNYNDSSLCQKEILPTSTTSEVPQRQKPT